MTGRNFAGFIRTFLFSAAEVAVVFFIGLSCGAYGEEKKSSSASSPASSTHDTGPWQSLFDEKTLRGWKITDFAGHGGVRVEKNELILESGLALTGVQWTNPVPRQNYEVELEGMKRDGDDFFCGLTFPIGKTNCTLIVGGWGGGVVGISSIDGMDASENSTTRYLEFKKNRWYKIRLRVTPAKFEGWIDAEKVVDEPIEGRRLGMRPGEIELSVPFGLASYQTTAALRNIRLRTVRGPEDENRKRAGKRNRR